jgi:hypothetical protein
VSGGGILEDAWTDARRDAARSSVTVNVDCGDKGVSSEVTNSAGQYAVPFLKPGSYSVMVEAPGFKKFVRERLPLSVGDNVAVDIDLDVQVRRAPSPSPETRC